MIKIIVLIYIACFFVDVGMSISDIKLDPDKRYGKYRTPVLVIAVVWSSVLWPIAWYYQFYLDDYSRGPRLDREQSE